MSVVLPAPCLKGETPAAERGISVLLAGGARGMPVGEMPARWGRTLIPLGRRADRGASDHPERGSEPVGRRRRCSSLETPVNPQQTSERGPRARGAPAPARDHRRRRPVRAQDDQGGAAAGRRGRHRRGPERPPGGRAGAALPPRRRAHGRRHAGARRDRRDAADHRATTRIRSSCCSPAPTTTRRGLLGLRSGAVGLPDQGRRRRRAARRRSWRALNGEAAISRRLAMRLVEQMRQAPRGATGLRPVKSPLTPREWEVVDLLAESRTTDEIAARARALHRDGALARQEHPAQARRPLARRRRSPPPSGCAAASPAGALTGAARSAPAA